MSMTFNIPSRGDKFMIEEGIDTQIEVNGYSTNDAKLLTERFCGVKWSDPKVAIAEWKRQNPDGKYHPYNLNRSQPNGEEKVVVGLHIPAGTCMTVHKVVIDTWSDGKPTIQVGVRLQTPEGQGRRCWKEYKIWLMKKTWTKIKYVPILNKKDFGWRVMFNGSWNSFSKIYKNEGAARRWFHHYRETWLNRSHWTNTETITLEKYNGQYWERVRKANRI